MMPGKRFTPEQIIQHLREVQTIAQVCKKIGITGQTCYSWQKEYGGIRAVHRTGKPLGERLHRIVQWKNEGINERDQTGVSLL